MNYQKVYDSLIERSKSRTLNEYSESHHIVPRCIGGTDDASNLARLTPEEHYLAHQLLVKIHPDNVRLLNAAIMMIPSRPSNKLYGWLKRKFSVARSQAQSGENNVSFGTMWIYNERLRECKRVRKDSLLTEDWKVGRKFLWDRVHRCKQCDEVFDRRGLEDFCSQTCKRHYKSQAIETIDNNLEPMITFYEECLSIDRTLKTFGVRGERAGNRYFSEILKSRNIPVRGQK